MRQLVSRHVGFVGEDVVRRRERKPADEPLHVRHLSRESAVERLHPKIEPTSGVALERDIPPVGAHPGAAADVVALDRLSGTEIHRQFNFRPFVDLILRPVNAGDWQIEGLRPLLVAAGEKEPQAVFPNRSAEGCLVDVGELAETVGNRLSCEAVAAEAVLERRPLRPTRFREVIAQ